MRIKISKKQWKQIGKTAQWMKPTEASIHEIEAIIKALSELKSNIQYLEDFSKYPDMDQNEIPETKNNIANMFERCKNSMIDLEGSINGIK